MTDSTISRRTFLKGAIAACALIPFGGALAACSSEGTEASSSANAASEEASSSSSSSSSSSASESSSTAEESAAAGSGSVLVAYYSAQGHTEAVAQAIADELGADLFTVTPVQPYSEEDLDWTNDSSRVSQEHNDESLRDVELEQATPDGWEGYDTVFVGYPIWWGIAAWPIDGFVAGNDWSGKTVIPFCTSSSSGMGESGQLLAEAAGSGDWQEGMRFRSSASASEVSEWAAGVSA